MSSDINTVALTGRLTRDAEIRYGGSGTAFCNFSLANGYSRKQGEEWKDETNFFDCVLIGKRAEALHKYLVKGKQIAVKGRIQQDRWEKDGQKRSAVKVMIDDLQLLGSKGDGQQQSSGTAAYGTQPGDMGYEGKEFSDDAPF